MTDTLRPQQLDKITFDDFKTLASALAKARTREVPTYAPALFEDVLTLWKSAQTASEGDALQVRKHIAEALEKLDLATKLATSIHASVSDLVKMRTDSQRNVVERIYAPEILNEADRQYWIAMRKAGSGEAEVQRESTDISRKLFREATLQSLERGTIATLKNRIRLAEHHLPQGRIQEAERELARLQSSLDQARQGELSVSVLKTKIRAGSGNIGSMLVGEANSDFVLDIDLSLDGTWAPGTFERPDAPQKMYIKERTENSLTVAWQNKIGIVDVNKLERQEPNGPWQVVAEFGPLSGWTTYIDSGLQPDTLYCYRVRSENGYGSTVTFDGNRVCGYTRNGLAVWRVQLKLRIADISNAGTDDPIQIRLNSPLTRINPNGNATWLDYGPRIESATVPFNIVWSDDFDSGREFTYDLNLKSIKELSDITMLTIEKSGTDAVGIAEISLLVNGVEIFKRYFGDTSTTCLWLDEDDGYSPSYTMFHGELRAHERWQAYVNSPPFPSFQISNAEIVSRLESMIGHAIHDTELSWDKGRFFAPAWVEATRVDDETLKVDLDLGADVAILDDPEVDIDFQLHFTVDCDPNTGTATLKITTSNFNLNVDFGILTEIGSLGLVSFLEIYIAQEIANSFETIAQTIVLNTGGLCPRIEIDQNGNINFRLG